MKGAAKCDNHCELQNSVNQWILERALHSRDIPGSMPASVLVESSCKLALFLELACVFVCHRVLGSFELELSVAHSGD